ncbi:MAG: cytochrome c-type biogenesis protein CcmH [Anaerolineales bacterium]|nr:cytochrome c-type biogenesis protein CcmH [Anaerolineales bacterium]
MDGSRKVSEQTANPEKAVTTRVNERILYGTLAILGILALVLVVILMLRPFTTVSQPQPQPALDVQQNPQTFPTPLPSVAYSVEAEALFASLNCLCGTCNDTLAECNCPEARQMKGYVDSLAETSTSKSEVMDRVVEKYGPEVLVGAE